MGMEERRERGREGLPKTEGQLENECKPLFWISSFSSRLPRTYPRSTEPPPKKVATGHDHHKFVSFLRGFC